MNYIFGAVGFVGLLLASFGLGLMLRMIYEEFKIYRRCKKANNTCD